MDNQTSRNGSLANTPAHTPAATSKPTITIPGYDGTLPRFQGNQPLFGAARFVSASGINWGYANFTVQSDLCEPYQLDDDLDEAPATEVGYDYDPCDWNSWMYDDVDREYDVQFKWGSICGVCQDESDPAYILRSDKTVVDANDVPVDNYWEMCIINRDQVEFWFYLMTGNEENLGVGWMQSHTDVHKELMHWIRENPDHAERWLNASPTPKELVGESEDLDKLIAQMNRAIRQGRTD
jgi:hypothetical protein